MVGRKGLPRPEGRREDPVASIVAGGSMLLVAIWALHNDSGWGWWLIGGAGGVMLLYGVIVAGVRAGIQESQRHDSVDGDGDGES